MSDVEWGGRMSSLFIGAATEQRVPVNYGVGSFIFIREDSLFCVLKQPAVYTSIQNGSAVARVRVVLLSLC